MLLCTVFDSLENPLVNIKKKEILIFVTLVLTHYYYILEVTLIHQKRERKRERKIETERERERVGVRKRLREREKVQIFGTRGDPSLCLIKDDSF